MAQDLHSAAIIEVLRKMPETARDSPLAVAVSLHFAGVPAPDGERWTVEQASTHAVPLAQMIGEEAA